MILKFFNANQNNALDKLQTILSSRKFQQQNESSKVKVILNNVKKKGDEAVISYEKKFSKIKTNVKNIKFSKSGLLSLNAAALATLL